MSEIKKLRDAAGNVIGHAVATESFVKAWLSSKMFYVIPAAFVAGVVVCEIVKFFSK